MTRWAILTALAWLSLADAVRDYTTNRRYAAMRYRAQIAAAAILSIAGMVAITQI
ncbi:hypothetical protein [Nocardia sp. NPDC051570]|uniref:hypothetical protein n=1 Tax=Nocardia sp. NPDC051570 TaxID=3364324 RepID=UPI00378F38CF